MALLPDSPELKRLVSFPLTVLGIRDVGDSALELHLQADQEYRFVLQNSMPDELHELLLGHERSRGVAKLIEDFREGKPQLLPVTFEGLDISNWSRTWADG
ncbi:MAG: hypothetical protein HC781_06430 [Leptolyngbyaceae cyanobacterium CSU_1_4]|nr:hypothetical protein [Leptolyngbyaceae cyanobacterium CSU_1_4]